MSDAISFTSTSPRFGLPFLFAGQAQKEISVNEAHALADMLLHPAIVAEQGDPPASPEEGQCWLVGTEATGVWAGHEGEIACLQSGTWLFAAPRNGMSIFDEETAQLRRFHDGWHSAAPVNSAENGTIIDTEARTAISGLIAALMAAGILPPS